MKELKRPTWIEISFPIDSKEPILDIASGVTDRAKQFSGRYISFDINREVKPEVIGDAQFLPFRSASISTVLCMAALEHIKVPNKTVNEILRVLKKDGMAYISVPFMYPQHDWVDYHRFTEEGIKSLLKKFKIREIKKYNSGLFSTIFSWSLPASYNIPSPIRESLQSIVRLGMIITSKIDICRDRFYSSVFIVVLKNGE